MSFASIAAGVAISEYGYDDGDYREPTHKRRKKRKGSRLVFFSRIVSSIKALFVRPLGK